METPGKAPRSHRRLYVLLAILLTLVAGIVTMGLVMIGMPGRSHRGPLPPLTEEEIRLRDVLLRDVRKLAGEIGERHVFLPEKLEEAARWIEAELSGSGLEPRREEFRADGRACRNVWAEIPGSDRAGEIVVVGAHYDSTPGTPGANDNGTGVAALLAIARALRAEASRRTLRVIGFVNEEPPFFQTESMGSFVHAKASRARGDRIVAMFSLETIGYYSDAAGSQHYPPPFSLIYPSVGDFIGFVGNFRSRRLVRDAIRAFRETTRFPSEGAAVPGTLPGIGWSDHWGFWQAGYPAIMVTDTAPFRYPWYHTAQDTPDKVDGDRLARVVAGLVRTIRHLANR